MMAETGNKNLIIRKKKEMDVNIKSDTVDKAIEVVSDSTKKSRNALDTNTSEGINKFFELLKATPLGIKVDTYIAERPYKLEKAMKEMKDKYEKIPEDNRVEPSSYIALQTVNNLNYSLDEEYLKEMFENLLVADMDSRKKDRVLPSYIEIIKQLNKNDAEFLKILHKDVKLCSIRIKREKDNEEGYVVLDDYIIYNYSKEDSISNYSLIKLNPLVVDNLLMHRLIVQDYETYYVSPYATEQYEELFKAVKESYKLPPNYKLSYSKGLLELTKLGQNFIDICIS